MKLLSFGEIIWDVFPDAAHIGGAPLNLAAHASMQGADSYILSAIGRDDLGERALCEIAQLGVKADHVSVNLAPTGQCIVTLDENGVPSYNVLSGTSYDSIALPSVSTADRFDVLAFGTLALRGERNRQTVKALMGSVSFPVIFSDLNIRPPFYSNESISFCLENADIVKISDEELPTVTLSALGDSLPVEQAAVALARKYPQLKLVIITLGAKGSFAYDAENGESYTCPAAEATVVSTVGAGDSFGATFLTQYFDGKTIPECLAIASRVSAYVVSNTGAVPKYDIKGFI